MKSKIKINMRKKEEGFTLIEIIAVLVIMGILAAVAIPKFFDLQAKAKEKAVYTAFAELKTRVNQHFAKRLLEGATKGDTIGYAATDVGTDLGSDFNVTSWTDNTTNVVVGLKYKGEDRVYSETMDTPSYF
ncbi:prepilin-type N-terminal cleavage/methylation domain-containing protein [Thermodesulfobacteriota bacterium]